MRKIVGNKAKEDIIHIDDLDFNYDKVYCFYHKPHKTLFKLVETMLMGNIFWTWVDISSSHLANYGIRSNSTDMIGKAISDGIRVYEFDSIKEAVDWAYGANSNE